MPRGDAKSLAVPTGHHPRAFFPFLNIIEICLPLRRVQLERRRVDTGPLIGLSNDHDFRADGIGNCSPRAVSGPGRQAVTPRQGEAEAIPQRQAGRRRDGL